MGYRIVLAVASACIVAAACEPVPPRKDQVQQQAVAAGLDTILLAPAVVERARLHTHFHIYGAAGDTARVRIHGHDLDSLFTLMPDVQCRPGVESPSSPCREREALLNGAPDDAQYFIEISAKPGSLLLLDLIGHTGGKPDDSRYEQTYMRYVFEGGQRVVRLRLRVTDQRTYFSGPGGGPYEPVPLRPEQRPVP